MLQPTYSRAQSYNETTAAPEFFEGLQDIPLMNGLVEITEDAIIFDKPEGDIVEAIAFMDTRTTEQVLNYYYEVLPAFGWSRVDRSTYFREAQTLTIEFDYIDQRPCVRIMVRPTL